MSHILFIIIPIYTLGPKAQSQRANEWQSWGLNPGTLTLRPLLTILTLYCLGQHLMCSQNDDPSLFSVALCLSSSWAGMCPPNLKTEKIIGKVTFTVLYSLVNKIVPQTVKVNVSLSGPIIVWKQPTGKGGKGHGNTKSSWTKMACVLQFDTVQHNPLSNPTCQALLKDRRGHQGWTRWIWLGGGDTQVNKKIKSQIKIFLSYWNIHSRYLKQCQAHNRYLLRE